MKFAIALLALASIPAFAADVAPSTDSMDFGIASGALNSKVVRVTAGKTAYAVIGVDLVEPACNSVQTVIWVSDENLEGDAGGLAYNLHLQSSELVSAKAKGDAVIISLRRNNVEDCSKGKVETYAIQYVGKGAPLKMKRVK